MKIESELEKEASPQRAAALQKYFKTEKGGYGEGDFFLGITVPQTRKIALNHRNASFYKIEKLLKSRFHEARLAGLFILNEKFGKNPEETYAFYLKNISSANNWDLVDFSAHKIIGEYLFDKKKDLLYDFAVSDDLWKRRISIISTLAFVKRNDYSDALKISRILLTDKHDLIHKAVGWVLREVGKRDEGAEISFIKENYSIMPRTTLRYAIERFSENARKRFLHGNL